MELHDAEESMGITKILAHDIRMKKKSTNQGGHSLDCGFLWSYAVLSQTCTPTPKFHQWCR